MSALKAQAQFRLSDAYAFFGPQQRTGAIRMTCLETNSPRAHYFFLLSLWPYALPRGKPNTQQIALAAAFHMVLAVERKKFVLERFGVLVV